MEISRRDRSKATILVVCAPLKGTVLDKIGSGIRPRGCAIYLTRQGVRYLTPTVIPGTVAVRYCSIKKFFGAHKNDVMRCDVM